MVSSSCGAVKGIGAVSEDDSVAGEYTSVTGVAVVSVSNLLRVLSSVGSELKVLYSIESELRVTLVAESETDLITLTTTDQFS